MFSGWLWHEVVLQRELSEWFLVMGSFGMLRDGPSVDGPSVDGPPPSECGWPQQDFNGPQHPHCNSPILTCSTIY